MVRAKTQEKKWKGERDIEHENIDGGIKIKESSEKEPLIVISPAFGRA